MTEMNQTAVKAMQEFLEALGLDLHELGMEKTPQRVAQAYAEFFSGLRKNPADQWGELFTTPSNGMVAVRDIRFNSICEHHLLPFFGTVHVAYCPRDGKIAGFSHFADIVDTFSHRPQLQERMTDQIRCCIDEGLQPKGTLVIVKATQMCLTMRNHLAQNSVTVTTSGSGCLSEGMAQYSGAWKMLMKENANE